MTSQNENPGRFTYEYQVSRLAESVIALNTWQSVYTYSVNRPSCIQGYLLWCAVTCCHVSGQAASILYSLCSRLAIIHLNDFSFLFSSLPPPFPFSPLFQPSNCDWLSTVLAKMVHGWACVEMKHVMDIIVMELCEGVKDWIRDYICLQQNCAQQRTAPYSVGIWLRVYWTRTWLYCSLCELWRTDWDYICVQVVQQNCTCHGH